MPKDSDLGAFSFDVVLLAGGRSRRMGTPKGSLDFRGTPWIRHQIDEILKLTPRRVVVVVGEHSAPYRIALKGVPDSVQVVLNPDFDAAPFLSLQRGLNGLLEDAADHRGWIWVQPLDTVVPEPPICEILLRHCVESAPNIEVIRPTHNARNGHPVIMSHDFCRKILQVVPDKDDARLDRQIKNLGAEHVCGVPVNSANVLLDFNQPEQWQAFIAK